MEKVRRNCSGTKATDWCNWPDESFDEMDSTLAVQQYIQQTIRSDCADVDNILTAPEGQDEGVWKYEHLRQFCMELNGLAVRLQSECNPEQCTQMTATEQWIFLCAAHKTPKECPAIDYTRHTLDGAACLLNSNRYFPSRVSIKEGSVNKLGSVCRRVYRIFSHAYYHHRQIFDEFEVMASKIDRKLVALVTGSTSGIGLGIARKLASDGLTVIVTGFAEPELIDYIQKDFKEKYGHEPMYVPCDLTNPQDIERLCTKILTCHPSGVDILVNNAGIQHVCPIDEYPVAKWDEMIAVMLTAPFHLIRLLLPLMKANGWGRIINISSVQGIVSSPGKAPYSTVKHGIIGMTKGVALDTAKSGVTCNAVCPGFVLTPIALRQIEDLANRENLEFEDAHKKFFEMYHPTGKATTVEQIGDMVAFLISCAAENITGTTMTMDGGWTAQ